MFMGFNEFNKFNEFNRFYGFECKIKRPQAYSFHCSV